MLQNLYVMITQMMINVIKLLLCLAAGLAVSQRKIIADMQHVKLINMLEL